MADKLVVVNTGLISLVRECITYILPSWKWGLFQNDITIVPETKIADVVPASFSGYTGLKLASSWSVPAIEAPRCITTATPLLWVHNGGPLANWIYGFYVVDGLGELVEIQRITPAPLLIQNTALGVQVIPRFSARSEWLGS